MGGCFWQSSSICLVGNFMAVNNEIVKALWPLLDGGRKAVYQLIVDGGGKTSVDQVKRYMLGADNPSYLPMRDGHFGALRRSIVASDAVPSAVKLVFSQDGFTKSGAVEQLGRLSVEQKAVPVDVLSGVDLNNAILQLCRFLLPSGKLTIREFICAGGGICSVDQVNRYLLAADHPLYLPFSDDDFLSFRQGGLLGEFEDLKDAFQKNDNKQALFAAIVLMTETHLTGKKDHEK